MTLPQVLEAQLGPAELEAYLADLQHVERLTAVVKSGARQHAAEPQRVDIAQVRDLMEAPGALQLRYVWEGGEWWDTLFVTHGPIRLVRIQHPTGQAT